MTSGKIDSFLGFNIAGGPPSAGPRLPRMGIVVILYLLLTIFALTGTSVAGLNDDIKNELISYYEIDTNRCKQ